MLFERWRDRGGSESGFTTGESQESKHLAAGSSESEDASLASAETRYFDYDTYIGKADIPLDRESVESGVADSFRIKEKILGDKVAVLDLGPEGEMRVPLHNSAGAVEVAQRFYKKGSRGQQLRREIMAAL